jgi:hypothetical protein
MPTKQLETSIEIAASPQRVWRELTNFPKYRDWSRFVLAIEGEPRLGERLQVRLDDGSRPMTIKPELIVVRENEELCWQGKLGSSFVFGGQHYFRLAAQPDGYTRLTHGERFRGLLLPVLWKTLNTRTRKAFERFNEALRERAESTSTSARPSHVG